MKVKDIIKERGSSFLPSYADIRKELVSMFSLDEINDPDTIIERVLDRLQYPKYSHMTDRDKRHLIHDVLEAFGFDEATLRARSAQ